MIIWPWSAFYKNVQIFLSFANFYHQFINHYFKIAASLTKLLKGSVKSKKTELFEFPLTIKETFNELWKAFYSVFMLRHFNSVLSIWLETDAFSFAFIDILLQPFRNMNENDISWHFIVFWSQKMINVKICYKTYDNKLLIIIMFFKHWHHYLNGSQHFIKILTDYNNFQYFISKIRLNDHQS